MNEENLNLAKQLINSSYIDLAQEAFNTFQSKIKQVLTQRRLPDIGWNDQQIESFLYQLSSMDTNNFNNKIGVGERESRIYSSIVEKRHFYMGHGIGRSGDVTAQQPKAAGASLILKLTIYLLKDALSIMGYQFVKDLIVLPVATGMCLVLCLLTLKSLKPQAKYVIWPRIDQKTCFKCIQSSNLTPIIIENILEGNEIRTNINEIQKQIQELGVDSILCILSTTSCFSVRGMDNIEEIGKICKQNNIFHLVNNAYGLQCSKISNSINQTMKKHRLDLVVQSTDKNFMVPVGGSIVFSQNNILIQKVSQQYPGRANASPIIDMFITLLQMGKNNLQHLLQKRKDLFNYAILKLQIFCEKNQFILLQTPHNKISIGIYLEPFKNLSTENITFLGSIIYKQRIMGCRVISKSIAIKMGQYMMQNYGSHSNDYPFLPYLTISIAIGMEQQEFDLFLQKLESCLKQFQQKLKL